MNSKLFSNQWKLNLLLLPFLLGGGHEVLHTGANAEMIMMDNTVLQYRDGNSNRYYFYISPADNCIMEYDPVTERESSRGDYKVGPMFITAISMTDYNYLTQLLKPAISDTAKSGEVPEKECGALLQIKCDQRIFPVDSSFKTGRAIEKQVAWYRKKYVTTTGKAELTCDTLLIRGIIKEQPYESKKGIITGIKEYYFMPAEEEIYKHKLVKEYFIKLREGKVTKRELAKLPDKAVLVKAVVKKGLWDATDTQHASRFGDYVAITEIADK